MIKSSFLNSSSLCCYIFYFSALLTSSWIFLSYASFFFRSSSCFLVCSSFYRANWALIYFSFSALFHSYVWAYKSIFYFFFSASTSIFLFSYSSNLLSCSNFSFWAFIYLYFCSWIFFSSSCFILSSLSFSIFICSYWAFLRDYLAI